MTYLPWPAASPLPSCFPFLILLASLSFFSAPRTLSTSQRITLDLEYSLYYTSTTSTINYSSHTSLNKAMMSGSVDNQFADHVAYGQHGTGYPVLDAGQERTQGVAAPVNAGQVNADNGIASQRIAGHGDPGAAAAPAPVGQAAKDPLRRPDDAKPFQCVIIADGTHKIKFGQTDIFCRVAIKDDMDTRGWRFICDARPYANGSLKDHIAATRGPHWKAGDLIKVLNMADLRKIDQDILGPLIDCIVTQDERDDVKAARREEQRQQQAQQLGQQLGQQQPQPHDQQQEGQPRRYQRAPDGRLLNGITNGHAAQLYMPGVTTLEDARLAAESFTITMVPLPPGQGFAYYHESAPVSGRSLALHEVRFGNAYTQWQQQTPRTQGRILGEINGPEQGLLKQQPGLHADAYEGGQQQDARFEQNHEDGYGRDYHQQQVARYQQLYASPGHQQQIGRQQNDQADGGYGGRGQQFADAPQPQQIGYGGYPGGPQQFAGPSQAHQHGLGGGGRGQQFAISSQPQQHYSPAVGSQHYGPPGCVNGATGGLGGPGQQPAGQRHGQGQGSRGNAPDYSPNLDPLLYHQGPDQRRGDGPYGRNGQA